jgi:hypothetical protein
MRVQMVSGPRLGMGGRIVLLGRGFIEVWIRRVHARRIDLAQVRFLAEHLQRRPGADDEGDGQAEQHGHAGADRDGPHVGTHQARARRPWAGSRRSTAKVARMVGLPTFVHRLDHGAGEAARPGQVHVAVDVLHHHDGVVHQDADGEDEREQRDPVQGVAEQVGDEAGSGPG